MITQPDTASLAIAIVLITTVWMMLTSMAGLRWENSLSETLVVIGGGIFVCKAALTWIFGAP